MKKPPVHLGQRQIWNFSLADAPAIVSLSTLKLSKCVFFINVSPFLLTSVITAFTTSPDLTMHSNRHQYIIKRGEKATQNIAKIIQACF